MFAALADTIVTASAGVLVAALGGGFAFAGVIVNARAQARAQTVELADHHADRLDQCQARVAELERRTIELAVERDHWRDLAERFMPRRRHDDNPAAPLPPPTD